MDPQCGLNHLWDIRPSHQTFIYFTVVLQTLMVHSATCLQRQEKTVSISRATVTANLTLR